MTSKIIQGDCLQVMKSMANDSIDFIVCDPPYFLTNNSGYGFMGKSWDSIHDLSRYLWESNTFVNSAASLMSCLLLEKNILEGSFAVENAVMQMLETKNLKEYAQSVNPNSLSYNVQKKDSALLLVLTKQEVLDLLKELSPNHIKILELSLNGVKKNALFVIPISLLNASVVKNIALKNVLPKLKVKSIEAREIHLSSMDQIALKNVIEEMIGAKSENQFTKEINGLANTASSIVEEKKSSVITSYHIEKAELTKWITSLLCVINAIQSSKEIHNYLIENFYQQIFKEALRICKPGSMLAAFGGTRTFHRLTCAIEDAGWEIKDVCMFLHGQGFPKAMNFGKKLGGKWEGYSSCGLKPAYEPIILAMKPLDGTYAQNAEKWGVAGINIDDSRISCDKFLCNQSNSEKYNSNNTIYKGYKIRENKFESHNKGRWPANIILEEEAAQELDQMSGFSKSPNGSIKGTKSSGGILNRSKGSRTSETGHGDSGGASRFFYCAKTSPSERKGSTHPTMKPLTLMRYLIKLLAPPGDPILLDPFAGSGSTLIAAKELGIRSIGIELSQEYCDIANARIASAKLPDPDLFQ